MSASPVKRSKVVIGIVILGFLLVTVVLGATLAGMFQPRYSTPSSSATSPTQSTPPSTPESTPTPTPTYTANSTSTPESNSTSTSTPSTSSSLQPIYFKVWTDPKEGAFSILCPKGWTTDEGAGTQADPWGILGFRFDFVAIDPTQTMRIFLGYPVATDYYEPSGIYAQYFSQLGVILQSYLSAKDFAPQLLLPQLQKSFPDAQLFKNIERAELAGQLGDPLLLVWSWTVADTFFTYTNNGVPYRAAMQVMTVKQEAGQLYQQTIGYFGMWNVFVSGYSAPEKDFKEVIELYSMVMPTFRANSDWLKRQAQNQAQQTAMIFASSQRTMAMDYNTWTSIENAQFEQGRQWMMALDGTGTFTDPAGNQHDNISLPPSGYDVMGTRVGGDPGYYPSGTSPPDGYDPWQLKSP